VIVKAKTSEDNAGRLTVWLERATIAAMFLFVLAAPHSIAATQTAWLLGLLFWVLRFAVWPRPAVDPTPIDYAMLGFFILTGVSAMLSYEPTISIGKLRAASLFTIVYLFAENIRSPRLLRTLAILLVASCMINVLYTFGQYAVGRGVKVYDVSPQSPLAAAQELRILDPQNKTGNGPVQRIPLPIFTGDTLLEIDGRPLSSPEQLATDLEAVGKPAKIKLYRVEWIPTVEVPRGRLLPGSTAEERLGIQRWTKGRDWRAEGFYGHWITYAEALQLIASLALGLFISLPRKASRDGLLLALAIAGISIALLLTVTRASWLAFLISAAVIAAMSLSRRKLILIAGCAVPLILAGLFVLHQKRSVGFLDQKDESIRWRETVQREGLHLLMSSPRHLLVGIGMDSLKAHWREWGLFDNGRLPMGHMHSDYLQIALERGVPALLVWLILMAIYGRMLWRLRRRVPAENWIERGIVLGALGGLIGFMASGVVHYNWGDSEVAMIFYLIMGLSLVVERQTGDTQQVLAPGAQHVL
jgi:O-antigen ligase